MNTESFQDRHPLSFNQKFLELFDQGDQDGPFGPKYNISYACRVRGPLNIDSLGGALNDVVSRHGALRTIVVRDDDAHQQVFPPSPVPLEVRDLSGLDDEERDARAERLLLEVEAGQYAATETPLLHAVLGRFDEQDAVLILIAHHTAADEWSMPLIARDLAARYAARASGTSDDLPPAPQFVEYATWEQEHASSAAAERKRAYWREKLSGARVLATTTDHARSDGLAKVTAWDRFTIPSELCQASTRAAKTTRSSPFMMLLAAYKVYLMEQTGETDIVVMTFGSGRGSGAFHETVGSFFNFIPLRTDLAGCETFLDVVNRVRRTCLQAYANELPFPVLLGEVPEVMESATADDAAICAFQVFRSPLPGEFTAGDVRFEQIRSRHLEQRSGGDVPDGAMWHLEWDGEGDLPGCLAYNTNLFTAEHMARMARGYIEVLRRTVTNVDTRLRCDSSSAA